MTLPGEAAKTDAGHWTRTTFIDETGATNLPENSRRVFTADPMPLSA
jgi:hypothetical protein